MRSSKEAFWWSLFSAGGVLAALFMPVFVIVTGLALPFGSRFNNGETDYQHVHQIVSLTAVRCVLFVVLFLSLFHCGHRIRHILMDLGLRHASATLSVCCYGGALVGTVLTALVLLAL